jgi:hypothetical protein
MREHLKFKQLLNQFKSLKFEEEYVKDFLMEANEDFENAFENYLKENGITNEELEGPPEEPQPPVEDDGKLQESSTESVEMKHFKKAHKKLVRILHPDRQRDDDPRKEEREEDFKIMTTALTDGVWAEFFEIADKYNVELDRVEEANRLLLEDIDKTTGTIEGKKKTFSWFLAQCGESQDCRDNVIEVYLKSKYGWSKDK